MEAGGPARNTRNGTRYSRICFTINNWTEEEYTALTEYAARCWKWCIIGKETAPDTGTPHLQGAAVFGKQIAATTLCKLPGLSRAHIEPMGGTPEQSRAYCSEDGDFWECGSLPEPGKRNDLQDAVDKIRQGHSLKKLVEEGHGATVAKYYKGLTVVRSLAAPQRTSASPPPKVIWLFGPTDVGKTHTALVISEKYFGGDYWISNRNGNWFDGYDGQQVAIIDDFRYNWAPYATMLRLLDKYPYREEFKGGFVNWTPTVIFITCPFDPEECYNDMQNFNKDNFKQLERRITKVVNIKSRVQGDSAIERVFELISGGPAARTDGLLELAGTDVAGEELPMGEPVSEATPVIDLTSDDEELYCAPTQLYNSDIDDPEEEEKEEPVLPLNKTQFIRNPHVRMTPLDERPHKFVKGKKIYLKKK